MFASGITQFQAEPNPRCEIGSTYVFDYSHFLKNEDDPIPWGLDSDRNCSTSGNIPVYNVESNNCSGINNSSSNDNVENGISNVKYELDLSVIEDFKILD